MNTGNINVGITVLLFAFLFFIISAVVTLISSGNLLQGIFKKDKDKIRDAMPYFVPSFLIFMALFIFFLSAC